MERLICIAIGYACGLFQTAYILGKIYHIDIRKQGSGNLGSTNEYRTATSVYQLWVKLVDVGIDCDRNGT